MISSPFNPNWAADQRVSVRMLVMAAGLAGTPLVLTGCNAHSFFDRSVTGRWEATPVSSPILDRIVAIEGPQGGQAVETSSVRPDDLVPEPASYRVGPGDNVEIVITDYEGEGRDKVFQREVDPNGFVELDIRLGRVVVDGLSQAEIQTAIAQRIKDKQILNDPQVQAVVTARRRATFNMIGAVTQPGLYTIPRPDYRLLEAMTASGRFSESIPNVYIIRQIPLDDRFTRGDQPSPKAERPKTPDAQPGTQPKKDADALKSLIEELSGPEKKQMPSVIGGGAMRYREDGPLVAMAAEPPDDLSDALNTNERPPAKGDGKTDATKQPEAKPAAPVAPNRVGNPPVGEPEKFWVFRDGKWVQVTRSGVPKPAGSGPTTPSPQFKGIPGVPPGEAKINPPIRDSYPSRPDVEGAGKLVTQRVIEVPMAPLLAGSAAFNVVIRPGDVIRIPSPPEGLVYMTGELSRPGPYNLPVTGRLTLTRAVVAAGGLSTLAVPEKVDITRMIGPDRQATIMLNFRAIKNGTEPDVVLKSDDIVNVGTDFWAFPIAVIRGGFRASYGFGFIVDRNFQGEIFGPDIANQR